MAQSALIQQRSRRPGERCVRIQLRVRERVWERVRERAARSGLGVGRGTARPGERECAARSGPGVGRGPVAASGGAPGGAWCAGRGGGAHPRGFGRGMVARPI